MSSQELFGDVGIFGHEFVREIVEDEEIMSGLVGVPGSCRMKVACRFRQQRERVLGFSEASRRGQDKGSWTAGSR